MKMTYEELNNKDVTDQATNMVQLPSHLRNTQAGRGH